MKHKDGEAWKVRNNAAVFGSSKRSRISSSYIKWCSICLVRSLQTCFLFLLFFFWCWIFFFMELFSHSLRKCSNVHSSVHCGAHNCTLLEKKKRKSSPQTKSTSLPPWCYKHSEIYFCVIKYNIFRHNADSLNASSKEDYERSQSFLNFFFSWRKPFKRSIVVTGSHSTG